MIQQLLAILRDLGVLGVAVLVAVPALGHFSPQMTEMICKGFPADRAVACMRDGWSSCIIYICVVGAVVWVVFGIVWVRSLRDGNGNAE